MQLHRSASASLIAAYSYSVAALLQLVCLEKTVRGPPADLSAAAAGEGVGDRGRRTQCCDCGDLAFSLLPLTARLLMQLVILRGVCACNSCNREVYAHAAARLLIRVVILRGVCACNSCNREFHAHAAARLLILVVILRGVCACNSCNREVYAHAAAARLLILVVILRAQRLCLESAPRGRR
jgi:hypothetical protein